MTEEKHVEVVGPDHPIARFAHMLADEVYDLGAEWNLSRFDMCVALANACGNILADASLPPNPPPHIILKSPDGRPGKVLTPDKALDRIQDLHGIMRDSYLNRLEQLQQPKSS